MADIVVELIKMLRKILYRDFYYVLSGALIITTIQKLEISSYSLFSINGSLITIFFIGACHAVGYVNQELWAQFPWLTVSTNHGSFNKFLSEFYRRHTSEPWKDRDCTKPTPKEKIDQDLLDRTIDLKQIGSSMGSCGMSLSIITIYGYIGEKFTWHSVILSMIMAVSFLFIAWLKTMQASKIIYEPL